MQILLFLKGPDNEIKREKESKWKKKKKKIRKRKKERKPTLTDVDSSIPQSAR